MTIACIHLIGVHQDKLHYLHSDWLNSVEFTKQKYARMCHLRTEMEPLKT